jgi:hypothetical protein
MKRLQKRVYVCRRMVRPRAARFRGNTEQLIRGLQRADRSGNNSGHLRLNLDFENKERSLRWRRLRFPRPRQAQRLQSGHHTTSE